MEITDEVQGFRGNVHGSSQLLSICDDLANRSENTLYTKTMTLETTTMATAEEDCVWSQKFRRFTGFLEISESCDGLVCIYDVTIRVKLMNPASGMSISLPLARIQRPHIEHPDPALQLVEVDPSRGRLCISELKGDCKQEFWWMVEDDKTWERIFSVDLRSTSTWFRGITSIPLTPVVICRDSNKVVLSLTYQDNLVSFDLDPHSPVYHLCSPGYYGLAVPYFPSLLLC